MYRKMTVSPITLVSAEGEHAGHRIVRDAFGIEFHGANQDTSFYCLDCHEALTITNTNGGAPEINEISAREFNKAAIR